MDYQQALPTREELIARGYPYGKAAEGIPMGDPREEYRRTKPDYVVYRPWRPDGVDQDNEHFQVVPVRSGKKLFAVWTQSSVEGHGDNHLMLSETEDFVHWRTPRVLSGAFPGREEAQANWGFPVVNQDGRIYLFCSRGGLDCNWEILCACSDDEGETFSPFAVLPMPPGREGYWVIWQPPMRCSDGTYLVGCTIWYGQEVPGTNWCHREAAAQILAFDNLDENPQPQDVRLSWRTRQPIELEDPMIPGMSNIQEPALAELPDGRIWMQARTMNDSPYWAVSADGGRTFSQPEPMRYADGSPVLHPLSPCPIYEVDAEEYFILVHQNNGVRLGFDHHELRWRCNYANFIRNPYYLCRATFDPDGHQPLKIGAPVKLIDTGDVAVGPKQTAEGGTYSSFTRWQGQAVLWYPDRKYYLLGKRLSNLLENLKREAENAPGDTAASEKTK